MELDQVGKKRIQNLRAVAARYETQNHLAAALGWTPSYLSQLIGPNPTRPMTERAARQIEAKLKLKAGTLDAEGPAPEVREAVSADLLDNVMVTVDLALTTAGWKLTDEKYRALVSHLYRAAAKRGDSKVDREEVDTLLRLVR